MKQKQNNRKIKMTQNLESLCLPSLKNSFYKFYKIILHFFPPKCSLARQSVPSHPSQLFPFAHSSILPPAFVPIIVLRVHIRWPDLKPKEGDFLLCDRKRGETPIEYWMTEAIVSSSSSSSTKWHLRPHPACSCVLIADRSHYFARFAHLQCNILKIYLS